MTLNETDNEETLVRLIAGGDGQAMHTLYCRYVRYLSAVCSRYIRNDEDIKDVLQDAFLKIFSSIGSFEYRGDGCARHFNRILYKRRQGAHHRPPGHGKRRDDGSRNGRARRRPPGRCRRKAGCADKEHRLQCRHHVRSRRERPRDRTAHIRGNARYAPARATATPRQKQP